MQHGLMLFCRESIHWRREHVAQVAELVGDLHLLRRRTRTAGLRELQALARLLAEELGVRDLGDDIRDARAELPAQLVVSRLGVFDRVFGFLRSPSSQSACARASG